MRILRSPDANTDSASSTESKVDETKAASSSAQTANEGSEKPVESLTDIVADQFKDSQSETKAEVPSQDGTKPEEKKTSEGEKEEPLADGEAKKADEKPTDEDGKELPPFHEHPRWKEMVEERNTLREQAKAVEAVKPLVEQQRSIVDYCQQNGVTPEQFKNGLEILALINTNPAEAVKKLQPIMEQLGQFDGSKLPSDLENAVAEGKIELEFAQEMAKLRAQNQHGTRMNQKTQEQLQMERAQQVTQANQNALAAWEVAIAKNDPDFKPKVKADEADGMFEFVADRFSVLLQQQPPNSPQAVVKLAEQAYNSVKKTFATRLTPKQAMKRPLDSTSSRTNARKEPESITEAVLQEMGLD
jgi:hypothetical protein